MKVENFTPIVHVETMVGNGSDFFVGRFTQNNIDDYQLEIFKQVETEKKTESIINERQIVQVTKIRPKGMDQLSIADIDKRAKAIQKYLKDNSIEDSLIVKNKKTQIETDLKFEVEKFIEEEIQLIEIPLIKTETEIKLKKIKSFEFLIRLTTNQIQDTCTVFINNL